MHDELNRRVQGTQDDVVSEPNDKQPASPILAAENEYPANNRQNPDEANPDNVRLERTVRVELGAVIRQSNDSGCKE